MLSKISSFLPLSISESFLKRRAHDISFLRSMLLNSDPASLERIARKKLLAAFKRAATRVPHYQHFLQKHHIDITKIKHVDDFKQIVPISNKKSYVKKTKHFRDLCIDADVSKCSLLARSSGYSGKSSTWAKSRCEQQEAKNFAALGLDLLYRTTEYKTLLIDTFALGSWVSGVDLLMIADSKCSVIAPGADLDETLNIFEDMVQEYEQIIFAGTPHFTKNLVEEGTKRGINFKKYRVNFLLGAEPFSESWRQYISSLTGTSMRDRKKGFIFSAYGASDLGVTGVNETVESAYIRYLCMKNPTLRKAIFAEYESVLPHLFQYDPTKYFIETIKNDELVFTNCDLEAMMPLIRYNIHDVGKKFSNKEMKKILEQHNIDLDLKVPLPFVFVVGRSDGTINFIGQLIYPQYIQDVLYNNEQLLKKTTGIFKLAETFDKKHNPFLQIDIQLKEGVRKSAKLEKQFHDVIKKYFYDLSSDFPLNCSILEKKTKKSFLIVNLFEIKSYPHKNGIKIKYV